MSYDSERPREPAGGRPHWEEGKSPLIEQNRRRCTTLSETPSTLDSNRREKQTQSSYRTGRSWRTTARLTRGLTEPRAVPLAATWPKCPRGAARPKLKGWSLEASRCRAACRLDPRCNRDHICGPGPSHASLCIVARSSPVSIAASTQAFAYCDRPVGTWPAAYQFDRVDLPST